MRNALASMLRCPRSRRLWRGWGSVQTNISSIFVMTWGCLLLMLAARCEVRGPEAADAKAGPGHWPSLPACAHGAAPALGYRQLLIPCAFCLPCPVAARPQHLSCPGFFLFSSHFIYFLIYNWSITCLRCSVSFFCTTTWISFVHASLGAQTVKNPPAMQETWIQSLGQEDPWEKGMATHLLQDSRLENPMDRGAWCRLQSMGSQRVRHNWTTNTQHACIPSILSLSLTPRPAFIQPL